MAAEGATCAVSVTACPTAEGFRLELRVAAAVALLTVSLIAVEVLDAYSVSPRYAARMQARGQRCRGERETPPLTVVLPMTALPPESGPYQWLPRRTLSR